MAEPAEREEINEEEALKRIQYLNTGNVLSIQRLQQQGAQISGIGEERHEEFIKFLAENGLIAHKLYLQFELEWHTHLREKLRAAEAELRKAKLDPRRSSGGLVVPPGAKNHKKH